MKTGHYGHTLKPADKHKHKIARSLSFWLQQIPLLLGLLIACSVSNLSTADSLAAADTVFRFQSKMAERGHVASQYALAYMYESGQGTDKDLALAADWYRRAAQQDFLPASDRLVYIDMLNNGYQPQQQQWLLKLKQTADDYSHKHQGESAFLLGQLYAAGLAVNKSLSMALKYLHLAEAANVIGSDSEIRRVETELDALRASYAISDEKAAQGAQQSGKASTTAKPPQPSNKAAEAAAHRPVAKQASQPAPRAAPRPVTQNKPATATGTTDTKNPQAPSSVARPQPAPASKQDNKAEPQEPHPMQVICSGWQRLNSACR